MRRVSKWARCLSVLVLAIGILQSTHGQNIAGQNDRTQPADQKSKPAIVVELFTAEGCSDCPPADDLLSALAKNPLANLDVIPLSFHVTYWNEYGWQDRFSDQSYTARQKEYQFHLRTESVYTPQSVIDGHYETVGNDKEKVLALMQRAAAEPKPVNVDIRIDGEVANLSAHATDHKLNGKVILLITEDGLFTDVKAGENKAKTLRHNAVVRQMDGIGKLKEGEFQRTVPLKIKSEWQREKMRVVVLVQDNNDRILGAGMATLTASASSTR